MADGDSPYLYRGVGAGTVHDVQQAAGGAIIPKGGNATMIEHVNDNITTSRWTSWTSDPSVAKQRFAGQDGVVFQVNRNQIPNKITDTSSFSRKPSEKEFLIEGIVYGVKRLP
jgi:hypothetical protein